MTESQSVIRVTDISKSFRLYDRPEDRLLQMLSFGRRRRYREYPALCEVSFDIKRGESVAIIGPNGAGKTTLLSVIAGITEPNSGQVEVQGRMAVMLALGSAFNPEFTGRENVRLSCAIMGLSEADIAAREPMIEHFAGIGEFIDQPVRVYSSGMQARLAFAVAAHVDADILVVDEILSVGDAIFAQRCARFIRAFRKRGTLLFVSHDLQSALSLCDRAIWMDHGRIQQIGPTRDVVYAYSAWSMKSSAAEPDDYVINQGAMLQSDIRAESHPDQIVTDIDLDPFSGGTSGHGEGGAKIIDVSFFDPGSGRKLDGVRGGSHVELHVEVEVSHPISAPIMGFIIKDRLGQILFGDNTFVAMGDKIRDIQPGTILRARFQFQMPYLPTGDYAVTTAITDDPIPMGGRMIYWMEDALMFKVVNTHVTYGLVAIPMLKITLDAHSPLDQRLT